MKKILVTGANGFIGTHLIRTLVQRGHTVAGIVRKHAGNLPIGVQIFSSDITNEETLENIFFNFKPEIVFHLAASINLSRDKNIFPKLYKTNVEGTRIILHLSQAHNVSFLIAVGSMAEYGNQPCPFFEYMEPRPAYPYALSKTLSSLLVSGFSTCYEFPASVARFPVIYGEGQAQISFMENLTHAFRTKVPFDMTPGDQTRDFLHVSDAVEALIAMSEHPDTCKGEIFNVCSGVSISLKEVVRLAEEITGVSPLAKIGKLPYRLNEQMHYEGNATKILRVTGWKQRISLPKGLEMLFAANLQSS